MTTTVLHQLHVFFFAHYRFGFPLPVPLPPLAFLVGGAAGSASAEALFCALYRISSLFGFRGTMLVSTGMLNVLLRAPSSPCNAALTLTSTCMMSMFFSAKSPELLTNQYGATNGVSCVFFAVGSTIFGWDTPINTRSPVRGSVSGVSIVAVFSGAFTAVVAHNVASPAVADYRGYR